MGITRGPKYPCIEDGLIFCFDPKNRDCWNGGTSLTDLKNGITATFTNMGPSDYTAGTLTTEGYVYLDGTDGEIIIASDTKFNALGTGPWTFSIFMEKTDTTSGAYDGIFYLNANNRLKFQNNNTLIYLEMGGNDTSLIPEGSWGGVDGNFHQITVSRENNGNALGYVDGVLKGTTDYSGDSFTAGSATMRIGYNSDFLQANVGPILFYNRALTASEVLTNYNRLKGRFGL